MKAPIIVYDLDGTLAKTEAYWLPLVEELFIQVKDRFGYSPDVKETKDVLNVLGKRIENLMAQLFPQASPEDLKEIQLMERALWNTESGKHPFVLYEGTLEVLAELHAKGYRQFVSSNCKIHYLDRMMTETGLEKYIERGICHGHWPDMDKWEFTREMLKEIDWEAGFFIGDSVHDMEAGRRNGMQTIYAAYGYPERPPIELIDKEIKGIRQLVNALEL